MNVFAIFAQWGNYQLLAQGVQWMADLGAVRDLWCYMGGCGYPVDKGRYIRRLRQDTGMTPSSAIRIATDAHLNGKRLMERTSGSRWTRGNNEVP